jgi:alanyl-tRNA synthetase
MRFDFTAQKGLTAEQVNAVEIAAQRLIDTHQPVYMRESRLSEAKAVRGLRAVFDETYPDPVRVVSVGIPVEQLLANPNSEAGLKTSVEFCGGT